MSALSRRELLTGLGKRKGSDKVRAPYIPSEVSFEPCKSCDAPCVERCPENVLFRDEEGIPSLSFKEGGCSYCVECLKACPEGVISDPKVKIRAELRIEPERCSAWQGVLCFSCKEPCLDNAIRFNGLYKPVILPDRCTACGYCVSVCPTNAIRVIPHASA